MVKRGVGSWQINKARTAAEALTKILRDGEWHRYQELRQKTELSSATLSKHLKELERGVVEKKIQLKSGEYPYPVVYRIKEQYLIFFRMFGILDAREVGGKTGISRKKLAEAVETNMKLINQAFSLSTKIAVTTYATDRNAEAFMQSLDSCLEGYREAARSVQRTVDGIRTVGKNVARPVELIRINKEISLAIRELGKRAQINIPVATLAEETGQ